MKKIFFVMAVSMSVLGSSCGGEKAEDKKEEKKEISEETKKAVAEIKTQFETLNADLTFVAAGISGKSELTAVSNLDSLKTIVEKWPKGLKEEGLSWLDTLAMDKANLEALDSRFNAESSDWATATKMVSELADGVENNKIDAQEAEDRVGSVKALLDSFSSSINQLKSDWEKIVAHNEKFKTLNQ